MPPSELRFEVLEALPTYGPMAEPFPVTGKGSHRQGFVVRVFPRIGEPWVGNFQPGLSSFSTAVQHPDGHRLVIISRGQAYIIHPDNRKHAEEFGGWYVSTLSAGELLLLVTPIDFKAIGSAGPRWQTRRISWDGMRDIKIDPSRATITGDAWSPVEGSWIPFTVNLSSGAVEGGSYTLP